MHDSGTGRHTHRYPRVARDASNAMVHTPLPQHDHTMPADSYMHYVFFGTPSCARHAPLPMALPGNTWAGEGDPGCVRTALNRT